MHSVKVIREHNKGDFEIKIGSLLDTGFNIEKIKIGQRFSESSVVIYTAILSKEIEEDNSE